MKTIPFFGLFVSLTLLGLPLGNLSAQGVPKGLRVDSITGFLWGHAEELVYQETGSPTLLSQLVWPLEGLFYQGSKLSYVSDDFGRFGFFTDLSLKFGFPGLTGTVTDKDWMSPNGSYLTNYSAHDSHSEAALLVDFKLGYSFPLSRFLVLQPFLSYSSMDFRWTARDGFLQYGTYDSGSNTYGPWDPSLPKTSVYGTGMAYEQRWSFLAFGLDLGWNFLPRWTLTAGLGFIPGAACWDQDDHFLRLLQFNENLYGGYGLEPQVRLVFGGSKRIDLSLSVSYRYIQGLRGDSYFQGIGISGDTYTMGSYTYAVGTVYGPIKDSAGVSYQAWDGAFTVSIWL